MFHAPVVARPYMRSLVLPLILGVLSLGALSLAACSPKPEETPARSKAKITGESLVIHTGPIDDIKRVGATLTTRDMGEAVARISGVLITLNVREGDTVNKGQIIGTIQDQRLNFEASAYAATAAQAEADYKRVKTLYEKGIYAQARMEQAETAYRAARAQRSAAGELAGQGVIRAPTSGKVVRADVPAGAAVMAGTSIATITAGPRVVRLQLPEQQARSLVLGQSVQLDANGIGATGTVSQIYPAIENGQIIADIAPQGLDDLLLGERVITSVSLGQRTGIKVPARFVTTRYGLDYVRLVAPDKNVSDLPVQTAPLDGQNIEILSGLRDGDTLLAYGASK